MTADPRAIQGGYTSGFCSENEKPVNQTLNPMGRQKGNMIFTARSDPAAAIRTEHHEGTAEESENLISIEGGIHEEQ